MELIQAPLPFEGAEKLDSIINEHVKPFVLNAIEAGLKRSDLERELAEEVYGNIMTELKLTEPNPFSMRKYDVEVSLGYDSIFTLSNYEFDGDEDALQEHIVEQLDITIEVKYEIGFDGNYGTYEDDGSMISHSPADHIVDSLSIDITERD